MSLACRALQSLLIDQNWPEPEWRSSKQQILFLLSSQRTYVYGTLPRHKLEPVRERLNKDDNLQDFPERWVTVRLFFYLYIVRNFFRSLLLEFVV